MPSPTFENPRSCGRGGGARIFYTCKLYHNRSRRLRARAQLRSSEGCGILASSATSSPAQP
jgi:hypothetical protein